MSAASTVSDSTTIERCRPEDVTPVEIPAESLESTAPDYLRELKRELAVDGLIPARVTFEASFDERCPLSTQEEVNRIRGFVRAASFLGAGTVTIDCETVADPRTVRPALAACKERAHREGLQFELNAPIELE